MTWWNGEDLKQAQIEFGEVSMKIWGWNSYALKKFRYGCAMVSLVVASGGLMLKVLCGDSWWFGAIVC